MDPGIIPTVGPSEASLPYRDEPGVGLPPPAAATGLPDATATNHHENETSPSHTPMVLLGPTDPEMVRMMANEPQQQQQQQPIPAAAPPAATKKKKRKTVVASGPPPLTPQQQQQQLLLQMQQMMLANPAAVPALSTNAVMPNGLLAGAPIKKKKKKSKSDEAAPASMMPQLTPQQQQQQQQMMMMMMLANAVNPSSTGSSSYPSTQQHQASQAAAQKKKKKKARSGHHDDSSSGSRQLTGRTVSSSYLSPAPLASYSVPQQPLQQSMPIDPNKPPVWMWPPMPIVYAGPQPSLSMPPPTATASSYPYPSAAAQPPVYFTYGEEPAEEVSLKSIHLYMDQLPALDNANDPVLLPTSGRSHPGESMVYAIPSSHQGGVGTATAAPAAAAPPPPNFQLCVAEDSNGRLQITTGDAAVAAANRPKVAQGSAAVPSFDAYVEKTNAMMLQQLTTWREQLQVDVKNMFSTLSQKAAAQAQEEEAKLKAEVEQADLQLVLLEQRRQQVVDGMGGASQPSSSRGGAPPPNTEMTMVGGAAARGGGASPSLPAPSSVMMGEELAKREQDHHARQAAAAAVMKRIQEEVEQFSVDNQRHAAAAVHSFQMELRRTQEVYQEALAATQQQMEKGRRKAKRRTMQSLQYAEALAEELQRVKEDAVVVSEAKRQQQEQEVVAAKESSAAAAAEEQKRLAMMEELQEKRMKGLVDELHHALEVCRSSTETFMHHATEERQVLFNFLLKQADQPARQSGAADVNYAERVKELSSEVEQQKRWRQQEKRLHGREERAKLREERAKAREARAKDREGRALAAEAREKLAAEAREKLAAAATVVSSGASVPVASPVPPLILLPSSRASHNNSRRSSSHHSSSRKRRKKHHSKRHSSRSTSSRRHLSDLVAPPALMPNASSAVSQSGAPGGVSVAGGEDDGFDQYKIRAMERSRMQDASVHENAMEKIAEEGDAYELALEKEAKLVEVTRGAHARRIDLMQQQHHAQVLALRSRVEEEERLTDAAVMAAEEKAVQLHEQRVKASREKQEQVNALTAAVEDAKQRLTELTEEQDEAEAHLKHKLEEVSADHRERLHQVQSVMLPELSMHVKELHDKRVGVVEDGRRRLDLILRQKKEKVMEVQSLVDRLRRVIAETREDTEAEARKAEDQQLTFRRELMKIEMQIQEVERSRACLPPLPVLSDEEEDIVAEEEEASYMQRCQEECEALRQRIREAGHAQKALHSETQKKLQTLRLEKEAALTVIRENEEELRRCIQRESVLAEQEAIRERDQCDAHIVKRKAALRRLMGELSEEAEEVMHCYRQQEEEQQRHQAGRKGSVKVSDPLGSRGKSSIDHSRHPVVGGSLRDLSHRGRHDTHSLSNQDSTSSIRAAAAAAATAAGGGDFNSSSRRPSSALHSFMMPAAYEAIASVPLTATLTQDLQSLKEEAFTLENNLSTLQSEMGAR